MTTFSTAMQIEALDLAIRHVPMAAKAMRSAEMELHAQVLQSLRERLVRALEREKVREVSAK